MQINSLQINSAFAQDKKFIEKSTVFNNFKCIAKKGYPRIHQGFH